MNLPTHQSSLLNPAACYSALLARDVRFDGQFFVAVTSTRIYCRPVCKVRPPKAVNCRFYHHAAQAEQLGFRPCLKCRPELAPGHLALHHQSALAQTARVMFESNAGCTIGSVATRLGITERHLRRLFQDEFGVSPIEFDQTQRLLFAKRLLTDTQLPMQQVAQASGFSSVRRFNTLFLERYRMPPTRLRKATVLDGTVNVTESALEGTNKSLPKSSHLVRLKLAYHPPFDWNRLLQFLALRSITGVEHVVGDAYARVHETGWLIARHDAQKNMVIVDVSVASVQSVRGLMARLRRLFDLHCDPVAVHQVLGALAQARPGLRLPGAFDGFELSVRAVLGQQITVKAATTLAGRFAQRFGTPSDYAHETLEHPELAGLKTIFPTADVIANATIDQIASLGIVAKRAQALITLAQEVTAGRLDLSEQEGSQARAEQLISQLCALPGFGPWTAHYIAMRVLGWPDAFPAADLVVMKAMKVTSAKQAQEQSLQWSPWRAYAVMHLWASQGSEK